MSIYLCKNDTMHLFHHKTIMTFFWTAPPPPRCFAFTLEAAEPRRKAVFSAAGQVQNSTPASQHKDSGGLAEWLHFGTLYSPTLKSAVAFIHLLDTILWEQIFKSYEMGKSKYHYFKNTRSLLQLLSSYKNTKIYLAKVFWTNLFLCFFQFH